MRVTVGEVALRKVTLGEVSSHGNNKWGGDIS